MRSFLGMFLWEMAKLFCMQFVLRADETVQIEIGLSEYGGNKKAVRTDGLLAKHQN